MNLLITPWIPVHRQLRGIEGARVRQLYKLIAQRYRVEWRARDYDPHEWDASDIPNRCLSAANACLYGVTEADDRSPRGGDEPLARNGVSAEMSPFPVASPGPLAGRG